MKTVFYIDCDSLKEAKRLVNRLKENRIIYRCWERLSSSKKGKHFRIQAFVPTNNPFFLLGLRFALGDCSGRIKLDIYRLKAKQKIDLLFKFKNGKWVSRWRRIK